MQGADVADAFEAPVAGPVRAISQTYLASPTDASIDNN